MPPKADDKLKPIVIMGPTSSGKTDLALELAKKTGGEIISADSRQIYKFLAAGTAKPAGEWINEDGKAVYKVDGVPYHLVDTCDPMHFCDAGRFTAFAETMTRELLSKSRVPIFAGGTGMYIQAFWNGMDTLPQGNPEIRKRLSDFAAFSGKEALYDRLRQVDREAAEKIPPGNIQRVIRALEVHELTGLPISQLWTHRFYGTLPTHKALFVVLNWNKAILHARISERVHAIFPAMMEETKKLLDSGYPEDCPALKTLGYPQMIDCIYGRLTQTEATHKIISLTQAYAKRQMTWFRRYKNIVWLNFENQSDWNRTAIADSLLSQANLSGTV